VRNKLQKFRHNFKKSKGFTLVELIVVIIIIAIITAVAVPALTSFQDNARKSRIQSEHRELATAIQSYIGSQDDPETVTTITMEQLAPYISKNSKGDSAKIMDALAKNDTEPAHKIDGTTLVSTFHPSGAGASKTKDKTWIYDWRYSSSHTN